MAAYDISASLSNSSAANPIARFGNVTGGGTIPWYAWAALGIIGLIGFVWLMRRNK